MKIAGAFVAVGLLAICCSLTGAAQVDIDWTQVKPIDEFDHYWQRLPAEWQIYRTARPSGRIVNGVEALPGQFPYQIALISDFGTGSGLCGGTVITNNYILTAAHCVVGGNGNVAIGGTAILGAHDRNNVNEPTQQRISFTQAGVSVHPGYDSSTIRNDIATVRLSAPAVFNARVQPIHLPARSDSRTYAGLEGTASGFGRTSDASANTSPVVMFTRNPILSNAQCNSFWSTALVQDQNICLDASGGRSPCNGDSGGPLTVQDNGSLEVGIASFVSAAGCASGAPSVWVRISFFRDWIEQNSDFVFRA